MSFVAGSVVVKMEGDITDLAKASKDAKSSISSIGDTSSKTTSKSKDSWLELGNTIQYAAGDLIAGGIRSAFSSINQFMSDSVTNAKDLERSLIVLDTIAPRFGINAEKAKEAAKSLGKELQIGPAAAAESLQNLFKGGLNLEQSIDLMKRFTNEAITGKSANISLSEAVSNLSFAYATNNSALGNMSGVSENFEDITEKGRKSLIAKGVAVDTITEEMAKYEGIINLTNLTLGASEKLNNTLSDSEIKKDLAYKELSATIGGLLSPALMVYNNIQTEIFSQLGSNTELVVGLAAGITTLAIGFAFQLTPALSAAAVAAWAFVSPFLPFIAIAALVGVAVAGLAYLFNNNFLGIKDAVMKVWDTLLNYLKPAMDQLKTAWDNLYTALVPVWDILMAALLPALQQLWQIIQPVVIPILGALAAIILGPLIFAFGLLMGILYATASVFNWIAEVVRNNMGNINSSIDTAVNAFNRLRDKAFEIKNSIVSAFNAIQSGIANAIKGAANSIVDNVNLAIDAINAVSGQLSKVPGAPSVPQLQRIPRFAKGVRDFDGGLATINEGGVKEALRIGDTLYLPSGTDVYNGSETQQMMGNQAAPNITFQFMIPSDANIRDFAKRAKQIFKQEGYAID